MQGLILAAGMGKRLKNLTADKAKCMVKVNGVTLIERALRILDKKSLTRIIVVVGYEGDNLKEHILSLSLKTPVEFIENEIYDKTNNIYSLLLTKDEMIKDDTLLLESDVIFEEKVVDALLDDERPTLALVDKFESWMDGTCVIIDKDDKITDFIPGKRLNFEDKDDYYKTVNLYKFDKDFLKNVYMPFLSAYQTAMGVNEYYESVIKYIAMLENTAIRACRLKNATWYEIDDKQDLDIASTLFAKDAKTKYEMLAKRFGGYWRYPGVKDYCYLVNPYYPPAKMVNEIKANSEILLTQYPSGMAVNSLLASKNFGVPEEKILVGNGAAELIKSLMEELDDGQKTLGFVTPTFEEYHHRFKGNTVIFNTAEIDFSYNADDVIGYFDTNKCDVLVLINPDNPSGNCIDKKSVMRIIEWAKRTQKILVLDESFLDFSSGCKSSDDGYINEETLDMYDKLYVVKSISKSYGIPGLRLGVLASSDTETIKKLKKDVAIWNINSFAEFFMQICEKYKKDYAAALALLKSERKEFIDNLSEISYIKTYPSEANYLMCELTGVKAEDLATYLLEKDILIKVLTDKIGNGKEYIRLAVKKKEENAFLVECLKEYKA